MCSGKASGLFLLKESSERITEFIMPSSYQDTLFTFLWSISLSYCTLPVPLWLDPAGILTRFAAVFHLRLPFGPHVAVNSCCLWLQLFCFGYLIGLHLSASINLCSCHPVLSFLCLCCSCLCLLSCKFEGWEFCSSHCYCRSFKSSSVPASVISRSCCVWLLWQDSKWVEEKQYLLRTNQELREKVH